MTAATPAPTCTLTASPTSIVSGNSSSLSWTTTDSTSFSIDTGVGVVAPTASGSTSVSPVTTTLYTGTATGDGGEAQCATTVTVTQPSAPAASPSGTLPPLINVTKIPTPLALPGGPGSVTYDYVVSNLGVVAMSNVTVTDDKCAFVSFIYDGDTNGDSKLDTSETWKYRCTTTLSQTTTGRVTATGHAYGMTALDIADATVVVGASIAPPLVHLVKVPSVFVLPAGGGLVTYQYNITNPGTVPLSDVSIYDDKCVAVRLASHAGDVNGNNLLDPGETWRFSCVSNLTQTTTNTGTASGHANGLVAYDFSPATVVVAPPGVVIPKLPNVGLPPYGTSTPLDAALAVGILMAILAALAVIQKRRNV